MDMNNFNKKKILLMHMLVSVSVGGLYGMDALKFYNSSASAAKARTEIQDKIARLEDQFDANKLHLRELSRKRDIYRYEEKESISDLWDRYYRVKAKRNTIDLRRYDEEIQSVKAALQQRLNGYSDQLVSIQETKVGIEERKEIRDLDEEIERLKKEKEEVLDELRRGEFCSKCERTPSQILVQTNQEFQEHLGKVKGEAVPASYDLIEYTKKKYDTKISALSDRINSLRQAIARQKEAKHQKIQAIESKRRQAKQTALDRVKVLEARKAKEKNRQEIDWKKKLKALEDSIYQAKDTFEENLAKFRDRRQSIKKEQKGIQYQLDDYEYELNEIERDLSRLIRREKEEYLEQRMARKRQIKSLKEKRRSMDAKLEQVRSYKSNSIIRTVTQSESHLKVDKIPGAEADGVNDENPQPVRSESLPSISDSQNRLQEEYREFEAHLENKRGQIDFKIEEMERDFEARNENDKDLGNEKVNDEGDIEHQEHSFKYSLYDHAVEKANDLLKGPENSPLNADKMIRKLIIEEVETKLDPYHHIKKAVTEEFENIKGQIFDGLSSLDPQLSAVRKRWKKERRITPWSWNTTRAIDLATSPEENTLKGRTEARVKKIAYNIFTRFYDHRGWMERTVQYFIEPLHDFSRESDTWFGYERNDTYDQSE